MLTALYAQPLTRILRLTIDDVDLRHGEVSIRLGELPTPVPDPFAGILLHLVDNRSNLNNHNVGARWLFPSVNPNQLMTGVFVRTARWRTHHQPGPNTTSEQYEYVSTKCAAAPVPEMGQRTREITTVGAIYGTKHDDHTSSSMVNHPSAAGNLLLYSALRAQQGPLADRGAAGQSWCHIGLRFAGNTQPHLLNRGHVRDEVELEIRRLDRTLTF